MNNEETPPPASPANAELVAGWESGTTKRFQFRQLLQGIEATLVKHKHILEACAIGVALYVGYVTWQTYREILLQTKLQAAHARGTEAARVECNIGPFGEGGPEINLINTSLLDARDVAIKYEFQLVSIPSFATQSAAVTGSFTAPFVRAPERLNTHFVQKSVAMPGYTQATIDEILAGRLGLLIHWSGSYNDGLDNIVQFPPNCVYWLKYQPEPTIAGLSELLDCNEARIKLANARKNYELFLKKKAEQPKP